MFKKSQAALEFLTTYAWAFLVILIMIGALAYFGVLSPTKILPDRCTFGAEINCIDHAISATANTFSLKLKNSIGEPIVIQSIALSSEAATPFSCTLSAPTLPYTWSTDAVVDFSFTVCNSATAGFIKGDKGKVLVTMNYNLAKSGATYARQVSGEIFATIT